MIDRDSLHKGTLYVVATPIGNLGDLSNRALETLNTVDLIACEDTRHTRKLCTRFKISTPLTSYYREKEQEKACHLIQQLQLGKDIALVSDAGTPGVSDPGAVLVDKARKADVDVRAVAGPSALAAALSISGLAEPEFFFGGFLPVKKNARQHYLQNLRSLPFPLIFYESPHRVRVALQAIHKVLGDRPVQLFRELTKIHEQCIEGTVSEVLDSIPKKVKGELVLIVRGVPGKFTEKPQNLEELLLWYRDQQQSSLKDASRQIASDLDLPRSEVYKKALSLWKSHPKNGPDKLAEDDTPHNEKDNDNGH